MFYNIIFICGNRKKFCIFARVKVTSAAATRHNTHYLDAGLAVTSTAEFSPHPLRPDTLSDTYDSFSQ